MAATYVTAATLKSSLGVGTLYDSYTWIEDTCQAAQDLINGFLWFDAAPVVGTSLVSNVATVSLANPGIFTTGQSVTIAGLEPLMVRTRLPAQFLMLRLIYRCQVMPLICSNIHAAIALSNMQK